MAVCRHCGAIIDDGLDICPDCGQPNTDVMDESYLDSLLSSLVESEPVGQPEKEHTEDSEDEILSADFLFEDVSDVEDVSVFEEALDFEEVLETEEFSDSIQAEESIAEPEEFSELEGMPEPDEMSEPEEEPDLVDFFMDEPEESYDSAEPDVEPDADVETDELFNIFDEMEENDVDVMVAQEFDAEEEDDTSVDDFFQNMVKEESSETEEPEFIGEDYFSEDDVFATEDFFGLDEDISGMIDSMETKEDASESNPFAEAGLSEDDIAGLDDLFQGFNEDELEEMTLGKELSDPDLEELLAAEIKEETESGQKKKADERSIWQRLFGNVPIDPSKKKPEPTPEEIEAAKKKKEEEKKKTAEEKKVAAAEKKAEAKKKKEEKAREAQLKKEEKEKKKMEAAKQVLEELEETRINRVGASIVFVFFGIVALILIVGSNVFTYNANVKNAEKNFAQALNNDVKYYTRAYEQIFGLEMKNAEDEELEDKILTVMFVNKELNSYNSYMGMKDYESALHSLIKGLYRYGVYLDHARELSIDRDMDFVRTQILKELELTFGISEDESVILKQLFYESTNNAEKAVEYNMEIYRIVKEAENLQ